MDNTQKEINVKLSPHARFDCIPLRYCFVPEYVRGIFRGTENVIGTQNQKKREIDAGRKHFIGSLEQKGKIIIEKGTFVIARKETWSVEQIIVSVLPTETTKTDRAASDMISQLRKEGKLTSEQLANEICPKLKFNKVNYSSQILDILTEIQYKSKFKERDKIHQEAMKELEKRAQERIDKEFEKNEKQRQEFLKLENEIKNLDLQKKSSAEKETIDISAVCTLKKVTDHEKRKNSKGKIVNVTRLYFEEDVPIRTMDEWADKNGTITELAKNMIGKKVRTTVWEPEIYNSMRWWNNIHEVGDRFDEEEK